ncbi:MAG: discoidin domain-containing protein [Candidatus Hydrogenedentota bacterium]
MWKHMVGADKSGRTATVVLAGGLAFLAVGGFVLAVWAGAASEEAEDAGTAVSDLPELVEAAWVHDDRQFHAEPDSPGEPSTAQDASGAVDGVKTSDFGFHTASNEVDPWWQVDLGEVRRLDRVVVYNRTGGHEDRTRDIQVLVSEQNPEESGPEDFRLVYEHDGSLFYGAAEDDPLTVLFEEAVDARVVRLRVPGRVSFALVEVEVYAADDPETNIALGKPADQKSVGPYSHPGTQGHRGPGDTFTIAHTREVLSRAKRLAARLKGEAEPGQLAPLTGELRELSSKVEELAAEAGVGVERRREVYMASRRLLREIAWTNPALTDIDRLLFVKRHDPGGVFHMVDQYYGFNARPGGGLFVLENPFGEQPRLTNLLNDSVVENGQLEGQRLEPGAFGRPGVHFDGQTIYFPYTLGKGEPSSTPGQDTHWTEEASFHIFRVNADGSGLAQLTGGPRNDFDPCVLPDGRVAFMSERRGGEEHWAYLRCGRHCPVYTLHAMEPDGSDIHTLSYHETQEWNPSVTHDGMIIYTRWDYVDRDTNVAHHPWITYPDGRDARAIHGNYPSRETGREGRPWMTMQIRAIPGSRRYVGVAAAHHGYEFGSLVLIDPRGPDDGAMSQVERLTPEVPFPEAEGVEEDNMIYGTPWPLSEDDYLVVYDGAKEEEGRDRYNRGIYWMDRDGNRELIYRDPNISAYAPMPLRPRPKPPVIPRQTARGGTDAETEATISVMNVYDSQFEWPEGTKIDALRIIQALPKTTPAPNDPRIGAAQQTNARAVLGTVPVEEDGSAYFEAPAGKTIYFQALDEEGMAVQSMRSATYVHPGEHLSCQGCHEYRHSAPIPSPSQNQTPTATMPLALQRSPSQLRPEPEGSRPFNYPRLVQPVLDQNCVDCHQQEGALDLSGEIEGPHGFSRSYTNLASDYGFFYDVTNGSFNNPWPRGGARTEAGRFGAREAKLTGYLEESHYGVQLSDEEKRRIIVWLDANSEFLGAYEDVDAQRRGEVVWPSLD